MLEILQDLARSERGCRLLINLLNGLDAKHIDRGAVVFVLEGLTQSTPPHADAWAIHLKCLCQKIFSAPDDFQFKGPRPNFSPAEWMTVKSMDDLCLFMRGPDGQVPRAIRDILGLIDATGPHQGMLDEHYVRFAETVSDDEGSLSFLLARSFDDPKDPSRQRPVPSWYSRWCHYPHRDGMASPSEQCSGRMRDWLGLPYGLGDPLFVVRARHKMNVVQLDAYRPTPWDGFDNPLYKHKVSPPFESENCGSTADIELLRASPAPGSNVEGGPEMVSRGVTFDPKLFVCEYLGTAPAPDYDLYEGPFHRVLLQMGESIERIIERLSELLRPKKAVS